jgi:hypothetical protein
MTTAKLTAQQEIEAAKMICNSRELCGNEREAFKDWCADNGIKFSTNLYQQANFAAGRIWRKFQIEAGVDQKYVY